MNGFMKEWWESRPPQRWWWRCLSLLALVSLAGLVCGSRLQGAKPLAERYRWSASQAIQAGDWQAADLWLKKLVSLEGSGEGLDFAAALVAEQRQELDRARRLMETLAQAKTSEIRGGVGLWMAHDLLRRPEALNREGLNLARDMLILARRGSETSHGADMILEIMTTAGFTPDAAQILEEATPNIDDLRLRLAERYVGPQEAGAGANPSPLPPSGSVDYALRLAESHVLLQSWSDAELVLLKAMQEQDDVRLRQSLAKLYVAMSVSLEREGLAPLPESIRLVQRSYLLAPEEPLVLDRLAMLLRSGPNYPPKVQERLYAHIRGRLNAEPTSPAWRAALVMLEIQRGTADLKDICPEDFLRENPEARLLFARLHRQRNELERCHAHAQIAVAAFRERLSNSSSIAADRISLSEALVLLDRWKDAAEVLTINGIAPHTPELRTALSNVYLDWSSHTPDISEKVNHLLTAWQTTPGESMIIVRLLGLTQLPSELSGTVLTRLQDGLDKGQHVSLAALVLGSTAAARDDYALSRSLLETAYRDLPEEPILLNNLAWVLIQGDVRDARRALKLVNRAMTLAPSTPELRETRGRVLYELRRWNEAIVDLKTVVPMFPQRTELHAMLAKAFEETGQPELAFRHRQLAVQSTETSLPAPKPQESAPAEVEPAEIGPADAAEAPADALDPIPAK